MNETVTAVYEHGVLRPLMPLHMLERTRVQICILTEPKDRQRVRQVLLDAGIIRSRQAEEPVEPVSEAQIESAARALAAAGPLSERVLAERGER
jgi:predicted DNA-binding antitoxin AbrB/MazE fold protein